MADEARGSETRGSKQFTKHREKLVNALKHVERFAMQYEEFAGVSEAVFKLRMKILLEIQEEQNDIHL